MKDKELKPCPFCGGAAKVEQVSFSEKYFVRCSKCKTEYGKVYKAKEYAIKKWNRRVTQ